MAGREAGRVRLRAVFAEDRFVEYRLGKLDLRWSRHLKSPAMKYPQYGCAKAWLQLKNWTSGGRRVHAVVNAANGRCRIKAVQDILDAGPESEGIPIARRTPSARRQGRAAVHAGQCAAAGD